MKSDWIVTNQGTSSSPRYYKMGTFTVPEGYTLDPDYNIASDKLARNFYCTADDASAPIQNVYVSGIQGKSAAEMVETVYGYGLYSQEASKPEGVIGGHEAVWLIDRMNDDENAATEAAEAAENEAPSTDTD